MELWGWIVCLALGQLIGVALCVLPQASKAGPTERLSDTDFGIPALWPEMPDPRASEPGPGQIRKEDAA